MFNKLFVIICWVLFLTLPSCTPKETKPQLSIDAFNKQSEKMIDICTRIVNEPNSTRMQKGAWGIQTARLVACRGRGDECKFYGDCLSKAIEFSRDDEVTSNERTQLKGILLDLKSAISTSRKKY